ncbi:MAG: hypothetical protein KJP01_03090, partial [Gramella sp.]|nr:hypothetical protein [Christiangramia sp.]
MKLSSKIFSCLFGLLLSLSITAQEGSPKAFWVHEDQVKPSMMSEYEDASKALVKACKENDIKNM